MIVQGKVWGKTVPLFRKNNVEMHLVEIKKDGFCSKHKHSHKFNQFIVCTGKLKIKIWKDYGNNNQLCDETILNQGEVCTVAPGEYHQFEAIENTTALEIYWVELNENDIERVDHGGMKDEAKTNISAESCRTGSGQKRNPMYDPRAFEAHFA